MLVRLLVRAGAEVRVVMTPLAREFITPLTMATLSKHPIMVDFFDPENGAWNSHVSLGEWADGYLIAPATANTIAKMSTGVADNLLLTTYLSARCPVFVAPAMDLDMFQHPTTQYNLDSLRSYGVRVIEPASGELASGLTGQGRMEEPERIVEYLERFFARKLSLSGRRILVTAGPTIEPIDPVRYISNFSSGKMGYAIAEELTGRGAEVILVSGKTALPAPENVQMVEVTTADEMYQAAVQAFEYCDGAVLSAAVSDFAPAEASEQKIKSREDEGMTLALEPTRDIAAALGEAKGEKLLVGFALETENGQANAQGKLEKKNLDFIVLNSMQDEGAGFGGDTNKVTLIHRNGLSLDYPLKSKKEVAADIVDAMESYLNRQSEALF